MKYCCKCYSSKSLQSLSFVLHIQTINGKRKPHFDFWVKRSVNLPVTFWLHFISNRISLRLLITDTSNFVKIWRMMIGRHSGNLIIKRLLVKVTNACFLIVLCVYAILVNCDIISALYMRFVTKVCWTFYVLEYSLSFTSIILHTHHPQDEISCKSCNSFKSTYLSYGALNFVQSRQSY